jgi:NAD(P)-dependent dehydrogenase (short-subunit alcohol dehydrogenase family)
MDLALSGRLAVVTGGSRGIGLAVTRALVAEGVQVVTGSRSISSELQELAAGGRVHPFAVDLASPDGPATLVARAEEIGGIDLLVNNAGAVVPRTGGFLSVSDAEWRATLELGLLATVRAIRAALPGMLQRDGGDVVTIASVNAVLPDPGVIDYSVAKAALRNLSKGLSNEFAGRGVRFNTISPGPVATDLWLGEHGVAATRAAASGRPAAEVAADAAAAAGTGRFTRPDEVAALVLVLASDTTANVTGVDLTIDGGLVQTI